MKWFLRLCLCLPLLAQAQTLTVKVPSRPINDLDKEYQLKLLELALTRTRFGSRLRAWVLCRLALTHDLVERMVGHRTRLAQERPARRDAHDGRGRVDSAALVSGRDALHAVHTRLALQHRERVLTCPGRHDRA